MASNDTFSPRIIEFQGGTNFRELGGYPAADGRRVKYGHFYRGGNLYDLQSAEDRARLDSLGLKLILDFRSTGECRVSPDYIPSGAKYCRISAMRYDNGDEVDFSPEGMKRVEREFAFLNELSIIDSLKSYYARMPFNNPAFQAVFDALEKDDVPMLFHCTSGKDRTGVGAMLILLALGCSRETALSDYLETNRCRAEQLAALRKNFEAMDGEEEERFELMVIQYGVLPKFAGAALDAILDRYDSWEQYFDREFGLDQARLAALRDKYLE